MKIIFSLAFGAALFFSPDFLTVLGNGIGWGGVWFLCLLALVFIFHAFTVKSYGTILADNPEFNNEYDLITESLGRTTGFIFPFITKALLPVCMGVGLLATAGYAFNELFVRWFPNMAFTLISLGILILIGLSRRSVILCQLIFTGGSILGIIILSIIGLISFPDTLPLSVNFHAIQIKDTSFLFLGFILLMGFEMAGTCKEWRLQNRFSLSNIMITALLFGFIILSLWGVVSLMHVSTERLADTYIPHLITARTINSIYGRKIMGLVIIFSSLGAVNALLTYVSAISGEVLSKKLSFITDKQKYKLFSFIFLALTIAGLLIFGMAGKPGFEAFIRGSIYLWLLNYAAIHLAVFVLYKKTAPGNTESLHFKHYGNLISFIFVCGLYCGLMLTDAETIINLKIKVIITGVALLIYLFYRVFISKLVKVQ